MGEDFGSLVRRFETSAFEQIRELHAAVERVDSDCVRQLAHKLRSAAVSLGARALANASADLEEEARTGELSGASGLLQRIESELATARAVLTN
jgi:HPt (histidine-containing phosphotransfer) domain-containing protein